MKQPPRKRVIAERPSRLRVIASWICAPFTMRGRGPFSKDSGPNSRIRTKETVIAVITRES